MRKLILIILLICLVNICSAVESGWSDSAEIYVQLPITESGWSDSAFVVYQNLEAFGQCAYGQGAYSPSVVIFEEKKKASEKLYYFILINRQRRLR